jgi:ABC-type amino acid transport substrate-binding protein
MARRAAPFFLLAAIIAFLFVALQGCSCGMGKKTYRIAVDPEWLPLDLQGQQQHVNGFVEELLIEVANYSGLRFDKIRANWDSLLGGLNADRYDAVLSSLPRYNFNVARYDFSKNFLDLGPVLVVGASSERASLGELSNELVGVLAQDQSALVLQTYPDVIMRNYASVPEALDALANGDIEGVLLDRLLAVNYVRDLFNGVLKIASPPLSDAGLRLLVSKGENQHLLQLFNRSLEHLIKKKKLQKMLQKWQLD